MSVKQLSTAVVAAILGTCTFAAQANNEVNHNWMPKQPTNNYWQTPNWSFNTPPAPNAAPPAYNNNYRRPVAPPPPPPGGPYNRALPPPPPPGGPYNRALPPPPPPGGQYNRALPPPPPPGGPYNRTPPPPVNGPYNGAPMPPNQYRGAPVPRNPNYNGPSAFYTPGYNPYRRNNNGWNNNRFWGRSGPDTWMHPNKRNWENSWDDMINSPSRMGEMPGGWTAPEVTMPNPIDMGDQFQDNVKDLPEQMRDMNVGNDVTN